MRLLPLLLWPIYVSLFLMAYNCKQPLPPLTTPANPHLLSYIRDDRVGLCFATYADGGGQANSSIALVPCEALSKANPKMVEKYQ
jgi:hypothetical protein